MILKLFKLVASCPTRDEDVILVACELSDLELNPESIILN